MIKNAQKLPMRRTTKKNSDRLHCTSGWRWKRTYMLNTCGPKMTNAELTLMKRQGNNKYRTNWQTLLIDVFIPRQTNFNSLDNLKNWAKRILTKNAFNANVSGGSWTRKSKKKQHNKRREKNEVGEGNFKKKKNVAYVCRFFSF